MSLLNGKKRELKVLLARNEILPTIDSLRSFLTENSRRFNTLILIESSFKESRKSEQQGVIDSERIQLEKNKTTKKLLDLIDDIEGKDTILETASYQPSNTQNLLNRVPSSSNIFVGYQKELEQFQIALSEFPLIAIEGLGGSGKTEFVVESIKRFIPNRERVIWVSSATRFDSLIQQAGYEEILRLDKEGEEVKFKNFEGVLDRDKCVIFLEDFHDNQDETYLRFLDQLSLASAHVIIVSRFLHKQIRSGAIIRLRGLGRDAMTHACNLREHRAVYAEISDKELETLCRLTEGHPLSIELGMQLLGYGESAADVLDAISGEEYSEHQKVEELSQRLLYSVLEHSSTSRQERELLLTFSVFRDRVPLTAIEALFGAGKIKYPLSQLMEKSLIRQRNKLYDSLPLIREFCLTLLKDKEKIHKHAADYFLDQRTYDFDLLLEENIIYHLSESNQWKILGSNIKQNGRLFIARGQSQLLNRMINLLNQQQINQPIFDIFRAQILLELKSKYKEAECLAARALAVYRSQKDKSGIAHALNVLGGVYIAGSEPEKARQCYKEALGIASKSQIPAIAINCYQYLSIIQVNIGEIESAFKLIEKGLELAEKNADRFGKASLLNIKGKIYTAREEYEECMAVRRKSFELFSELGARLHMVVVRNNIAVTLLALGKNEAALAEFKECLAIEKEIGSRHRIANLYYNIGGALLKMDNLGEALQNFEASLKIQKAIDQPLGCAAAEQGIGRCYAKMNLHKKAVPRFQASLNICEKIGYRKGMLKLYNSIGSSLLKSSAEKIELALECFLKALYLARQINTTDMDAQQQLREIKHKMGHLEFTDKVKQIFASWPKATQAELDINSLQF